ncbi:hypothetical protein QE152_g25354 [Popillia japonica]|uniref:F-box domain-containing protein n=1 Tax=Popillia japonica TaxID=7064 RepID=A0AAW1K2Z2_POPJA
MLFEILPAVVYQLCAPGFLELPVELIAGILRYLDPQSLLNAVRTYHVCKNVCMGDPILRQRLKTLLKKKKRQEAERRVNPCMGDPILRQRLKTLLKKKKRQEAERRVNPAFGVTVIRTEPARMFGRNAEKIVESRPAPERECLADVQKEFLRCKKRKINDETQPLRKRCNYRL